MQRTPRKLFLLCLLFVGLHTVVPAQQFSKNGHTVPVKGTIKALLVFAEVTGTGNPNLSPNWPVEGDIPINAGEYFDAELPASGIPEKRLSRLLWEASFGQYLVLGDYLETVVSVNQAQLSNNGITNVLSELDAKINSSTIAFGNPNTVLQEFDQFDITRSATDYRKGEMKPNSPNSKMDVLIILWRNQLSKFGCNSGNAVLPSISFVNSAFGSFSGVENIGNFGGCFSDVVTIDFVMQEYFHAMFGGNNWHSGDGAELHTFQSHTNGWGLCTQSQGVGMSNVVCGWDRNHLEWEHPGKNQTDGIFISVGDQNIGEAPSDISIQSHPGGATFLLRDFVTTGDAVRIKLPHLQDDGNTTVKNQYIWLENHQLIASSDANFDYPSPLGNFCNNDWVSGLYAYIQAGKDIKDNTQVAGDIFQPGADAHPNRFGSWLFPFTADGRYDYVYGAVQKSSADPCFAGENIPTDKFNGNVKPNPLTGFSDLFNFIDSDNKGTIFQGDVQAYASIINQVGQVEYTWQYRGNDKVAYGTDKQKIGLSTNPAALPVYTHRSGVDMGNTNFTPLGTYDNRTIWLNGLSIEITNTVFNPATGANDIEVTIRWNDYDVDNDVRWCGNIKLSPNDFNPAQPSLNLKSGKTLLLDRGTSPTRHINPEVINGQNIFTDPTVFTCLDGSVFNVESGATVLVDNGSTLRLRSGSRLEVQSNATLIVDNGSRLELEDGSELTVRNGGSVVIRQAGGSTFVFGSNTGSDPVIRLLGPDALLDIAGNLHITDNKNFTFSGTGFVRFSATGFPSKNITAGANASMTFTGSGQNDLVLEVQQETLYGPEKLSFFIVTDAKVAMHPGARMAPLGLLTTITVTGSRITSASGTGNAHRGITVFGQPNVIITGNTFEHGKYGIFAVLTFGGSPMTIENNEFLDNESGLFTSDKGAFVNNCHFEGNGTGWKAMGMSFPSHAAGSAFTSGITGIDFGGGAGATLGLFNGSSARFNDTGIITRGSATTTATCSGVTDNETGFLVESNATLNLSQVNASGNTTTIKALDAQALYLNLGDNNFQPAGGGKAISGTIRFPCNQNILNANGNKWNQQNKSPAMGKDYTLTNSNLNCPPKSLTVQDNFPKTDAPIVCGVIGERRGGNDNALMQSNPLQFCPGCIRLTTENFSSVKLNEAVATAINRMETVDTVSGDDFAAIDLFFQILTFPVAKPKSDEIWLLDLSYSKMKEALSNLFFNGKITAGDNIPGLHPSVQQVVDVQEFLADIAGQEDDDGRVFYLTLDKGQVFRLADRRLDALEIFDVVSVCQQPDSLQSALLAGWRNLVFAEHLVLSGQVLKEDFESLLGSGTSDFALATGINIVGDTSSLQITCTGDTVRLSPAEFSGSYLWDFGDCSTSDERQPAHSFSRPGTYCVTLTQDFGCTTKVFTRTVVVVPRVHADFSVITPDCPVDENFIFVNGSTVDSLAGPLCTSGMCGFVPMEDSLLRIKNTWKFGTSICPQIVSFGTDTQACTYGLAGTFTATLITVLQFRDTVNNLWLDTKCADTASREIEVNFCPIGIIENNPACGGGPAVGVRVVLIDQDNRIAEELPPAITNGKGEFAFDPNELRAISSAALTASDIGPDYTFGTLDTFNILDQVFRQIESWIEESPTTFTRAAANEAWAAHLGDLPDTSATLDTVKFKAATAIAVNGNAHVTGFINKEAGFTTGKTKFVTVTYGRAGDTLWVKEFGSASPGVTSIPLAIAVNPACDVYVTGVTDAAGHADFLTIKYDSSGNLQWSRTFDANGNFDQANAIAVDEAGNIYVTGMSDEGLGDGPDYLTVKYDPDGNEEWDSRFDGSGSGFDQAHAIAVAGGFVYVTGESTASGTGADMVTVKYDAANGGDEWDIAYNGSANGNDRAVDIAVDADKNVYITGRSPETGRGLDITTIKYDSAGTEQWVQNFHRTGSAADEPFAMVIDGNSNIYVTGTSGSGFGEFPRTAVQIGFDVLEFDYTTIKYDKDGNEQWVRFFDGPAHGLDAAFDIVADRDGNVYVTGISQDTTLTQAAFSFSFGTSIANTAFVVGSGFAIASSFPPPPVDVGPSPADATTVMYDTDGNELWVERFRNPEPGAWSGGVGIGLDDEAGVYVTGFSAQVSTANSTTGVKITTVKYEHCIPVSGPELANSSEASSGGDKTVDEPGVITETTTEITIYPNPYSGKTNIAFSLAEPAHVKLEVLTVLGQKIAEITDGRQAAGSYIYTFSAADAGSGSGVYLLRVTTGEKTQVIKLIGR